MPFSRQDELKINEKAPGFRRFRFGDVCRFGLAEASAAG